MSDDAVAFRTHLGELRFRLVRAFGAVLVGVVAAWFARIELFDLLSGPVREGLANNGVYQLTAIELPETMMVYVKLAVVAGFILASPVVFYQMWAFVSPGLHKHERAFVAPITVFSVGFFLLGVTFCYLVLLPFITDFLASMTLDHPDVAIQVTVRNAFSFSITLLLAFGIAFQLPLLLFFLCAIGVTTPRGLLRFFRYFLVLSFVIAAIFTPPDPVSQAMMAVPLNLLYLLGFGMSAVAARRRNQTGSGALDTRTWLLTGLALTVIGGGIGYGTWSLSRSPSLLDHVPGHVRMLAGLRWADARSRDEIRSLAARVNADGAQHTAAVEQIASVANAFGQPSSDGPQLDEVLIYVTQSREIVALYALSGETEHLRDAPVAGQALVWLQDDVAALGATEAIEKAHKAKARGLTISSLTHRQRTVAELRRAGPAWLVLWGNPTQLSRVSDVVLGRWDRPLVATSLHAGDDVELHATLDLDSSQAARELARRLDTWRDKHMQEERDAAIDQGRTKERLRNARRLSLLTEAVGKIGRSTTPDESTKKALDDLERLGAELKEELSSTNENNEQESTLSTQDVTALLASSSGTAVDVELRLTPAGTARLFEEILHRVDAGLPDELPDALTPPGDGNTASIAE